MSPDDTTLLDTFIASRDGAAFRALVNRYAGLVHSVARRVTGSHDLARDVTQEAFIRLAGRAASIPRGLELPVWLHRTTHSLAADLVRGEVRRKNRERAAMDLLAGADASHSSWAELAPVIDGLVDRLSESDRHLIVLRFYGGSSHAELASSLGLNEETVRRRVSRAVGKLRNLLARRGITTTTSALGMMLPAHAVGAAPAGSIGVFSGIALATPAAPNPGINLIRLFTMKSATSIAAAIILVLLMGSAAYHFMGPESSRSLTAADGRPMSKRIDGGITPDSDETVKAPTVRPQRPPLEKRAAPVISMDEELPGDVVAKGDDNVPPGSSVLLHASAGADGSNEAVMLTPSLNPADEGTPNSITINCKIIKLNAGDASNVSTLQAGQSTQESNAVAPAPDLAAAFGLEDASDVMTAPSVVVGSDQFATVEVGREGHMMRLQLKASLQSNGTIQLVSDYKRRE